MVNNKNLLVQGKKLANTQALLKSKSDIIPALKTELNYQAARRNVLTPQEKQLGRSITIMGDSEIPYALLKKIMTTCSNTDYRNISMAVERSSTKKEGA